MTISDVLTLIAILLAIIAFISERNREYIFLKLSQFDLIVFAVTFLYLHFLLTYSWWRDKTEALKVFEFDGFPSPEAWAYILSITVLFYSSWRVFFGTFPRSRRKRLMSYYQKLILRNEIAFLSQLIERYHIRHVIGFLQKRKTIELEKPSGFWLYDRYESQKEYNKIIRAKSHIYGANVFYNIIQNDKFVESVANINPYLFSSIIIEMNDLRIKDDDFVNKFLKILMINKNSNFFREVRNNQNLTKINAYRIEDERPILFALFNDVRVCSINQAWRGIGEQAILEMNEEAKKPFSPLRESNLEQENDTIWTFRITIAIWYFDIMVRQAIAQDVHDHMWMFYYWHFVEVILSNMPDLPSAESEQNRHSRNFELIETIISNLTDWKSVVIESTNNYLSKSIYDCVGQCLYEIAISNKLRPKDKNYLLNWIWENLINSFGHDAKQKEIINGLIENGFEMFRQPISSFSPDLKYRTEESQSYLESLNFLWKNRDMPKLRGELGNRATRFKVEVIDVLVKK